MLCLLLQCSREGTLLWKLLVPQRPVTMSPKHGCLSLELGIKFTSSVYKHWFLERSVRDMSMALCAWIRAENAVYYASCTALWMSLKSLCWPRVGTWVLQWLRGWFPCSKGWEVGFPAPSAWQCLTKTLMTRQSPCRPGPCHVSDVLQLSSRPLVLGAALAVWTLWQMQMFFYQCVVWKSGYILKNCI